MRDRILYFDHKDSNNLISLKVVEVRPKLLLHQQLVCNESSFLQRLLEVYPHIPSCIHFTFSSSSKRPSTFLNL